MTSIGNYAFYDCTSLTSEQIKWTAGHLVRVVGLRAEDLEIGVAAELGKSVEGFHAGGGALHVAPLKILFLFFPMRSPLCHKANKNGIFVPLIINQIKNRFASQKEQKDEKRKFLFGAIEFYGDIGLRDAEDVGHFLIVTFLQPEENQCVLQFPKLVNEVIEFL